MSLTPYVIEQSAQGERSYDIYSRLLKDRVLFLGEEVTNETANRLVAQLLFLEADNPEKPVYLYINSPGGSVSDGMAIYDTMQLIRCPVETLCVGMAASMAAVLLAAGTQGLRYALPNAEIMIHQPSGGKSGAAPASDIAIMAQYMLASRQRLNQIMAYHTGQSAAQIEVDTERDNFMDAQTALRYGLIDNKDGWRSKISMFLLFPLVFILVLRHSSLLCFLEELPKLFSWHWTGVIVSLGVHTTGIH